MKTRALEKVRNLQSVLDGHAATYNRAREAMIKLGAGEELLEKYKPLHNEHLGVKTAALNPKDRGMRNEHLAWFWKMDVPRDTEAIHWMSECR